MNIFHAYTRKTLRLNKTRTLVTIIGIILSVALITAVAEGAYSGIIYMRHVTAARIGGFSALYEHMTDEEAADVANDPEVAQAVSWGEVGYAEIESQNPDKPYLYIVSAGADLQELVAVQLTQGRMPQNSGEILLPEHLYASVMVHYALGDTLTLNVGARTLDGDTLNQHNPYNAEEESIADAVEKTYTVVGYYERFDNLLEDYSAPGFTAITTGETAALQTVFFRLNHPGETFDYMEAHPRNVNNRVSGRINSDLLYYYGATSNSYVYAMAVGLVSILIGLIMFGSIVLIYNSFSISVGERTKQFGLLKSIGATNKQIHGMVLYEALVLCVLAIPLGLVIGCVGIGVTLHALRGTFDAVIDVNGAVQMGIALNGWVLLFAAAVGLLMAVISAWIPAQRASRITAIDAIRQSNDVSIRSRQVKTSKLTYKIFGFSGMLASKNFKRNRRKYRATVVSLFLSVVLFISASSFCAYLGESVDSMTDDTGYDLSYYSVGDEPGDPNALYQMLMAADGVTNGTYVNLRSSDVYATGDVLTDTFKNGIYSGNGGEYYNGASHYYEDHAQSQSEGTYSAYTYVYFLRDEDFLHLLEENGLDQATFYNAEAPLALLYDHSTWVSYEEGGTRWTDYETFRDDRFPFTVDYTEQKEIEGYYYFGTETDPETGETRYVYVPQEVNYDSLQEDDYCYFSEAEARERHPMRIGAKLETAPYFVSSGRCVIYPYSFGAIVLDSFGYETQYLFQSDDHAATYESMLEILDAEGQASYRLDDYAASNEQSRAIITIVNVFSYGFIILISLIALANVFNTISTNISLRRREFAMLKSVGMTKGGFNRMMNFECLLYGFKGLLYGLPTSFAVTWLIYRAVNNGVRAVYHVPWYSVAIAVGSVFLVVFATMLYSMDKIKKDNPIDALKNENL